MMLCELEKVVNDYYDKLTYSHPLINSEKFFTNANRKWACQEILREIGRVDKLPFDLTPTELLNNFLEKMQFYASKNEKNAEMFLEAASVAHGFLENVWRFDGRKHYSIKNKTKAGNY